MSIEHQKIIDFVGIDEKANEVVLAISDHLDWEDPKSEHLLMLQDKVNDYLMFIENGELMQKYPAAMKKSPVIQVYGKYPLSDVAKQFYENASRIVRNAGFELRFKLGVQK